MDDKPEKSDKPKKIETPEEKAAKLSRLLGKDKRWFSYQKAVLRGEIVPRDKRVEQERVRKEP
ncbi:MAG TPA: hypothetical protein VMX74_08290 [Pirellulales bacterium]|nr:hypothetical protein [Pirellulales bacterium]